ncbi:hypothetical protein FKP32DRAFT_1607219 [Trametes sanguinea]|nr:hypothetical protein FKP32DRAFT_1607219 [Trametes sanguinea]
MRRVTISGEVIDMLFTFRVNGFCAVHDPDMDEEDYHWEEARIIVCKMLDTHWLIARNDDAAETFSTALGRFVFWQRQLLGAHMSGKSDNILVGSSAVFGVRMRLVFQTVEELESFDLFCRVCL